MATTATKNKNQLYLIYGQDELAVTSQAKAIIDKAVLPSEAAWGLEIINAQADKISEALASLQQCREALQTIGFLEGRKAVWLRDANFLDQGPIAKSKEVRARVQDLADIIQSGLPVGLLLVISATQVDQKSPLYKACQSLGKLIQFEVDKPWRRDKAAVSFAARQFKKLGLVARPDLINAFVLKAGTDFRQLQQEAQKLSLYLGSDHNVRGADLDAIVSCGRELYVWNFEDALADKNLAAAIPILRQLLFQKEDPIRLIAGLENRFRNLLILREALDQGYLSLTTRGEIIKSSAAPGQQWLRQALEADKRLQNSYVLQRQTRQAANFKRAELDRCRAWILDVRRRLVLSSQPAALVMEILVTKISALSSLPQTPVFRGAI